MSAIAWIGAIIAIGLLIIVHEGGHYLVARWCKMRVDRFSLGFGPALWSFRHGDTQFQIAPIPFGGFVQINGMLIAEEVEPDDPHAYPNRPAWQRFATIFAGPATNYLFAVVLALILYFGAGVATGTSWYVVDDARKGFDAMGKLEKGDRIVEFNGEALYATYPGATPKKLTDLVQEHASEPIVLTVLRDGKRIPVTIHARPEDSKQLDEAIAKAETDEQKEALEKQKGRYALGVELRYHRERRRIGVLGTVREAIWYPVEQTKMIATGLYMIVTGEAKGQLNGPVGITEKIKDSVRYGWVMVFELLMLLNVYLGLFNLFPLPALDGGRLVFLGYEMATRRRPNPKIEAAVHMVGILVLFAVLIVVTYKDIARLF